MEAIMGIVGIAGLAITAIGVLHNLIKDHKDLPRWEESDIEVDFAWVDAAIENGFLDGKKTDYAWPLAKRVSTLEMKGTYQIVMAINEENRTRHRLVTGAPANRHVLVRRISED